MHESFWNLNSAAHEALTLMSPELRLTKAMEVRVLLGLRVILKSQRFVSNSADRHRHVSIFFQSSGQVLNPVFALHRGRDLTFGPPSSEFLPCADV